jgi:hypothetical protein
MLNNYLDRSDGRKADPVLVCRWTSFNTRYWHLHATTLGLCSNDNVFIISSGGNESVVLDWRLNFDGRARFPRKNRFFCFVCVYSAFSRMEHYLFDKTLEDRYVYLTLSIITRRA